jgi:hypothetical protein
LSVTTPIVWGDDGYLLVGGPSVLRIPEAGGEPTVIAKADASKGEASLLGVQLLPGGKYLLVSVLGPKGPGDFTFHGDRCKDRGEKALIRRCWRRQFHFDRFRTFYRPLGLRSQRLDLRRAL